MKAKVKSIKGDGKFKGKGKYGKGGILGDVEIKKNSTT